MSTDLLINKRCDDLKEKLPHLSTIIVENISAQSARYLDGAKNIPRLFRRTNREVMRK